MDPHARGTKSRRWFLKSAGSRLCAALGAPAVAPAVVRAAVLGLGGEPPPSDRPCTGHIGLGGRGVSLLARYAKERAVALCDVDVKRLAAARRRIPADRDIGMYGDYRRLLERKDVDAVVIATPDHWHALPSIHACEAGKHVFCEKPLTLTIGEGRAMVRAARQHKRVFQTGSQQRSAEEFRRACEIVRSGHLGKLKEILVGISGVNYQGPPVPDGSPPPELDYDMWLGPAPFRPYNEKRVHYQFRFFWDYSGGQQTNWGAHHLDIAQWGHGSDRSGPIEAEGTAEYHEQGWYEVPKSYEITYRYADGVAIRCGMRQPGGTTFIGEKGRIHVNRGKLEADPPEILKIPESQDSIRLYRSPGHEQDWEDCIRTGSMPVADVEIGHRTATVCHLGNISLRLGRKVRWDPEAEQFLGDPEAQAWVTRPYRAPWSLPR